MSSKHERISVGGDSLRNHCNAGQAAKAIKPGGYDYVVLPVQSTLPGKNVKRMGENVLLFDELIERAETDVDRTSTVALRPRLPIAAL